MLQETPHNVARLAMALSCQVGVRQTEDQKMKGIYVTLLYAIETIRKNKDFHVNVPKDLESVEWQTFIGMSLAQIVKMRKNNRQCTETEAVNMCKHVEAAVQSLVKNPEIADQMARTVLGDMYPTEHGLQDGHHKTY